MSGTTARRALGDIWMQIIDHKKLAKIAVIQGLSHRDIARAVWGSNSHSYVGRIMRGKVKSIEPEAAVAWAHLVGVPVDDLFVTKSSKNPRQLVRDSAA